MMCYDFCIFSIKAGQSLSECSVFEVKYCPSGPGGVICYGRSGLFSEIIFVYIHE